MLSRATSEIFDVACWRMLAHVGAWPWSLDAFTRHRDVKPFATNYLLPEIQMPDQNRFNWWPHKSVEKRGPASGNQRLGTLNSTNCTVTAPFVTLEIFEGSTCLTA
ncbi:hypothetical protein TWF225_001876 [Orbilia oligospora]|nr:hypothetical protein TWF225_001876 [Orbilia oligospora]